MTLMSAIDMNAILECKALRYLTNGFLVCYLYYLNYCDLISVTEIDFGLVMQPTCIYSKEKFQSKNFPGQLHVPRPLKVKVHSSP